MYPLSLVCTIEVIESLSTPPIAFAHSHLPFTSYFIIIPSVLPLFIKFIPFFKSILVELNSPAIT